MVKKLFQRCAIVMSVLSLLFFSGMLYAEITLPDKYNVCDSQKDEFSMFPFCVKKNHLNKCNFCIKLLDVFPVKDVAVNVTVFIEILAELIKAFSSERRVKGMVLHEFRLKNIFQ